MRCSHPLGRIISAVVVLFLNVSAFAATIYVDDHAPGPVFDGSSWDHAYTILQFAFDDARSGDTILVAEGTYKPYNTYGGDLSTYRSFRLKNGVALYGGFDPASGVVTMDQRNWKSHKTIISGDLGWPGMRGDNSYHVFYHPSSLVLNSTAILDGFIITDGNANGDGTHEHSGGGMYNDRCSPTIRNCTFTENYAAQYGAAIYNRNDAEPTIEDCTFTDNQAQNGGAIANASVAPSISNCTFSSNAALSNGGAIYQNSAIPHLADCVFRLNTAESAGGAIYSASASPQFLRCTFDRNSAVNNGGAITLNTNGTPRVQDSVFVMNCTTAADGNGGAICTGNNVDATMTNCIFYYNRSANGGAILNSSNTKKSTINVCTFYANYAANHGGGMVNADVSPTVVNCIFWSNRLGEIYNEGTAAPSITYCDISGGYLATGNINSNPLFVHVPEFWDITSAAGNTNTIVVALMKGYSIGDILELDNDGVKRTITAIKSNTITFSPALKVNTTAGMLVGNWGNPIKVSLTENLHLLEGSPCIDAGTNKSLELPDHDIDTQIRTVDGDGNGTATVDMGADEFFTGIWFVDVDAAGLANGTSWINAFPTLQSALNAAQPGESIWIAAGTYIPTVRIDAADPRSACFQMKNGVQIYGGFDPSFGIVRLEQRDWDEYETILSGDLDGDDTVADNAYHVFYHPASLALDSTAVLDGVIVRHAVGKYGDGTDRGGGMSNHRCSPRIRNTRFEVNRSLYGGGMYNEHCSPSLTDCFFGREYSLWAENQADFGAGMYNLNSDPVLTGCSFFGHVSFNGGGMYNDSSNPILTDCVFGSNRALGIAEYNRGGGMYNGNSSNPELTGCTFKNNIAIFETFARGAGMFCDATSEPTLTDCLFKSNSSRYHGGALFCEGSSPVIHSTRFEDNSGDDAGGAVYLEGGSARLDRCVLIGNQTEDKGGGIFCESATPSIADCNFVEGSADDGGGVVLNNGSDAEFTRCGFIGNTVLFTGGGIQCFQSSPILTDCFFENNSATSSSGGIGGGMHCDFGANPELTRCRFEGNTAALGGGGFSASSDRILSQPVLSECLFRNNQATNASYGTGGAIIAMLESEITLTDCRFENNQALGVNWDAGGGAIVICAGSQVSVTDSDFSGNSTSSAGGAINGLSGGIALVTRCTFDGNSAGDSGGAMSFIGGDATTLEECRLTDNSAIQKGGGIYVLNSRANYRRCTFIGNSASTAGGAIYAAVDSSPSVDNSLFVENTASFGGAVAGLSRANMELLNCTFWSNSASGSPFSSGGAIYSEDNNDPFITNCILWNDSPNEIHNSDETCDPTVSFCIVEGSYAGGSHIISNDPLFLDPANGDFHLSFDSPAVDSSNNTTVPADITIDLEGDERIVDGDGNGSALVDFGALEFDSTEMGSFNGDFDVDLRDFEIFSETWMTTFGSPGFNPDCDMFPADGKINLHDLCAWARFWLEGR